MSDSKTYELLDYGMALVKTVRSYIPVPCNMAVKGGYYQKIRYSPERLEAQRDLNKLRSKKLNFWDLDLFKKPLEFGTGNCGELVNACLYIANTNPNDILGSTKTSGAYFTQIGFATDHTCLILHGNYTALSLLENKVRFTNIIDLCKHLMSNQSSNTYPVIVDPWLNCCFSVDDLASFTKAAKKHKVTQNITGEINIYGNIALAPFDGSPHILTDRTKEYHKSFLDHYKYQTTIRAIDFFKGLLEIFIKYEDTHNKEKDILNHVIIFYQKNLNYLSAPIDFFNKISYEIMKYIILLNQVKKDNKIYMSQEICIGIIKYFFNLKYIYPFHNTNLFQDRYINYLLSLYTEDKLTSLNIDEYHTEIISLITQVSPKSSLITTKQQIKPILVSQQPLSISRQKAVQMRSQIPIQQRAQTLSPDYYPHKVAHKTSQVSPNSSLITTKQQIKPILVSQQPLSISRQKAVQMRSQTPSHQRDQTLSPDYYPHKVAHKTSQVSPNSSLITTKQQIKPILVSQQPLRQDYKMRSQTPSHQRDQTLSPDYHLHKVAHDKTPQVSPKSSLITTKQQIKPILVSQQPLRQDYKMRSQTPSHQRDQTLSPDYHLHKVAHDKTPQVSPKSSLITKQQPKTHVYQKHFSIKHGDDYSKLQKAEEIATQIKRKKWAHL